MRKNTQHLHGGLRGLAAAAAIASLAAFGCSTNRTPGDGQPAMTAPATPSSTPGTSSGTNPPMASASAADIGERISRANDAAAIAASHQRERFLGVINPAGAQTAIAAPPSNQLIPPSAYANPQSTVNASISSDPTPVVTSGAGSGDGGIFLGSATTGATTGTTAAVTTGTTAAATTGATTGTAATAAATNATTNATSAAATINNSALATPATAAITATPGQFAAGPTGTSSTTATTNTAILSPTLTSSATPSPTRAANSLGSLRVTQATTTTPATSTTASSTTTSTSTTTNGRVVVPIRVMTGANGTVTVTNVNTTPPSTIKVTGKQ